MAEYIVQDASLTPIADEIRVLSGVSDKLSLSTMAENAKDANSEVDTQANLLAQVLSSLDGKAGGGGSSDLEKLWIEDIEGTTIIETLPDRLTKIRNGAFYSCTKLYITSLPDGVTSIGQYAFHGCTNLALTSLPDGITSINNYTFYNCKKLEHISLPAGITSIGSAAFNYCTGLTEVTFNGKPTSINSNAFKNCANLTTINVPWTEGAVSGAPWGATNATINYNYTGG